MRRVTLKGLKITLPYLSYNDEREEMAVPTEKLEEPEIT